MAQVVFALAALFLVSLCAGESFCPSGKCPEYEVIETQQDFEVRSYGPTEWITTQIGSTATSDILAASSRLKDYAKRQNEAGCEIPTDTWPVLVTVTEGEGDPTYFLSWFLPAETRLPENTDPAVKLERRPGATVYVRLFGGTPSLENGRENAKELREALTAAGKTFDSITYSGAGYDSYFSLTHHNEIWITAA